MTLAISPQTIEQIESGDLQALVHGVACHAALWLEQCGQHHSMRDLIGHTHCVSGAGPREQALMAAALDLLRLLDRSPHGRQAIADLGRKPVLQNPKGE